MDPELLDQPDGVMHDGLDPHDGVEKLLNKELSHLE
jgi:hypothetical protein